MAWFRKEKKPRTPRRERLEIPADAWEKCERCGHTDIREKFVRNLNVCPNCEFHRRIRAIEYANILLDDGTADESLSGEPPPDDERHEAYMASVRRLRELNPIRVHFVHDPDVWKRAPPSPR